MLVVFFVFQPLAPVFAQQADNRNMAENSVDAAPVAQTPSAIMSPTEQTITPNEPSGPPLIDQNTDLTNIASNSPTDPQSDILAGSENSDTQTDLSADKSAEQGDEGAKASAQSSDQDGPAQKPADNSSLTQRLPEIDKNTGALSYNYPIVVPPGRNNLQPDIALSYNSNSTGQNDVFGYGWSLNIPYIQRLNKTGINALYSSNYFYSSLDGELSTTDGTSYVPRTENGQFDKYTFLNNQWIVIAKNGTQYKFGYNAFAQQNDSANSGNVYKWMLQEIRDANNNYISYTYFKDAGQIYPLAIKYTGNGSADGIFEIDFQRISRPDNTASYATGFAVNCNYLINEIDAKINGDWVSKYVLFYAQSSNANKSFINSVTKSGKNSSGNVITLPPVSFNYQSNGNGWTPTDVSWNIPYPPVGAAWNLKSRFPQFVDLNGDGLLDLTIVGSGVFSVGEYFKDFTYINNGSGWTPTDVWNVPPPPEGASWEFGGRPPRFTDLNGDGLLDLIIVGYGQFPGWDNQYKDFEYINNGKKQDLLNQITYPQGGSTTITYKSSLQYVDDSGNPANKSPYPIFTVSQITNSDGFGNNSGFSYQYQGATYFYQGPFDKEFSGYKIITQTDSAGNVTKTYYHTGEDGYFKIGKPYRVEQYDNAGNLYKKVINKWDSYNLAGNAGFVKLIQTTQEDFDGTYSHKDKAESFVYDNATGNQTQKTNWGEVVASDDGNFSDVGSDKNITDISYAFSLGSNNVGSPSGIVVTDQNSSKIKEVKYYYDNLPFGSISLGNQTKEEVWISGSTYASTQKTYNGFGLVTQSKDANGNATAFVCDIYNLYPAVVTNALNQATQFVYNYAVGKPNQITDANGNIFKNTYDAFGRILKTEQPDQTTPTTLALKTSYVYTDATRAVSVQQTNYLDSSNSVSNYNYYDGLGRTIQTKKSAENNNFETKDFVYDNRGNLQKESLPYFSSGSGKTSPTGDSTLYATYAYDILNRKISIANAVGTTFSVYKNWQTTITDVNGNQKDFIYDAFNNLVKINEYNAGNVYTTVYTYDAMGNLLNITDALGNVRNFSYDGLGRKVTAQDLHNPADSVFGVWDYTYDSAGNLIGLTDAKNQTINYTYDALNRKISEDYAGKTGVEKTFTYDNCPNGKGLLCDAVSADQTEHYEYSATGSITKNTKIIDEKTFTTQYSSDRQGNQILIINPDNSQIKNTYNSAGLLDQTQRKESADSIFVPVVSNFDYSPLEQITVESFANGVTSASTYDPAKLYRLISKVATNTAGTQLQNLAYIYDNVGNILTLTDNSATDSKKTVNYIYDDLYRLTSAVASNTANKQDYTQTFVCEALGNILTQTKNSETIIYEYSGANPDAVSKTVTSGIVPVPVISYFVSSPVEIASGQQAVLSWAVSGGVATALSIDNNIGSVLGQNYKIVNPTETTTYILTAENDGGTITKSVTITVKPMASASVPVAGGLAITAKIPPVINSFSVSQSPIIKGQSTVLSWTLSGGKPTTLSIDNSVGSVLNKTSKTVSPTATKTYKLTAKNSYGSTTKYVTVTVNPPAPVVSKFTASSATITTGNFTTLSWTLSGGKATTLSINNGVGSVLGKTKIILKPAVTTTYTITAVNISGTVTKSVTVTVNSPSPIINSFSASSIKIVKGQQVTFSWALSGASPTTLSINNGVGSVLGKTSKTITPISATYTLTAKNTKGTATKSITIAVNPPPPIINSFTSDYATIMQGQSATLSWALSGGETTSLSINNGVGSVFGTTSKMVSPIATTTYILTAVNISGTVTKSVTVIVNPLPPDISSFSATSTTIIKGQSATLSWSLAGGSATSVSIDNGIGSVFGTTSKIVSPTVTTTYTLTAVNISGSSDWSVTIIVETPPPIINSFTADSAIIIKGQSATLSWNLSGGPVIALSIDNNIGSVFGTTSKIVTPNVTTVYTLTAENEGGSVTKFVTITVTVITAPVISTFTTTAAGLSWTLSGSPVTKLSIDNKIGSVSNKTSITVKPTITTTYVLTATNTAGTVIKPVTFVVATDPAPTTITKDYTYDANSNMTGDGEFTYDYDYSNRMISATNISTSAVITYAYDPQGQRIKVATPIATTIYPTQFYNTDGTTATKHIFANGVDIATVQGTDKDAKIYYTASDNLNSSSVMTDNTGTISETLDYFPFGQIRIDTKAKDSTFTEQRKYIGQEYDQDTGLNYLNARYYNSAIARFTGVDSVVIALGDEQTIKQITGKDQQTLLANPQALNYYSYANNNPIINSDSTGKSSELDVVRIPGIPGAHTFIHTIADQPGEDLSKYGSGPNYTIGGYMSEWWGGNLVAKINEPGNLNASRESYLASYPLAPPKGMSIAQYDQKLLESGYNLSQQDLGMYLFTGQPISNFPNSGNTSAQVIINAGGTVPSMPFAYIGPAPYFVYFPLGAGKPIGTPSLGQQLNTATRSYIDDRVQTVLNSLSSTLSLLNKQLIKANGK